MNGTLCYRSDKAVPGQTHDLYARGRHYYKRPGLASFLRGLTDSGHFVTCVYSSMMKHNIEAALNAFMPKYKEAVFRVLDR